jgi:aryl-alcohol dehydrogenase-like predicted oxidoreductase
MGMELRRLGDSGLKVSAIGLGGNTFGATVDGDEAVGVIRRARELGITFIDTADVYSRGRSEELIGKAIAGRRSEVVIATKVRHPMSEGPYAGGLSRRWIMQAAEDSLRRLGTDFIDLYQAHAPDEETPLEETLRAMDDLVRQGKVRYIGCSNYRAWQLADALWTSRLLGLARFECDQPRYNILFRMIEEEILPLCRAHGVGVIAYNPLAGGMLTGKYLATREARPGTRFGLPGRGETYRQRYWSDAVFEAVQAMQDFFAPRGKSLTHVALAWVLAQPGITSAILGASTPEQLEDSIRGADLTLDAEELAACDEAWFSLPRARDPEVTRR